MSLSNKAQFGDIALDGHSSGVIPSRFFVSQRGPEQ